VTVANPHTVSLGSAAAQLSVEEELEAEEEEGEEELPQELSSCWSLTIALLVLPKWSRRRLRWQRQRDCCFVARPRMSALLFDGAEGGEVGGLREGEKSV
jgi:hypothetical protein